MKTLSIHVIHVCCLLGDQEIKELKVFCKYTTECDWKGELRLLRQHLTTACPYGAVPCPKKCIGSNGEAYTCLRKDIDQHVKEACPKRQFQCPHCQEWGTHEERTGAHLLACSMIPIRCPNEGCSETQPAFMLNIHIQEDCKFTIRECKYRNAGCTVRKKRKDMEKHEDDDKLHLQVVLKSLAKQQEQLALLQGELRTLQTKMAVSPSINQGSMTFKVMEYKKKKENNEVYRSPSFYTTTNGYHLSVLLYPNGEGKGQGTHVSVYAELKEGRNDNKLNWPFRGSVVMELLNQLADQNHQSKVANFSEQDNAVIGASWGYSNYIPHSDLLHNPLANTQYLKDDTLYLRISVEVPDYKPWLEY